MMSAASGTIEISLNESKKEDERLKAISPANQPHSDPAHLDSVSLTPMDRAALLAAAMASSVSNNEKPTDTEPPPYEVVFARLSEIKRLRSMHWSQKCGQILLGACAPFLFCVLILALPITLVAVGGAYLDYCPLNPLIPIYLVVMGAVAIVAGLLAFSKGALPIAREKLKCFRGCESGTDDLATHETTMHSIPSENEHEETSEGWCCCSITSCRRDDEEFHGPSNPAAKKTPGETRRRCSPPSLCWAVRTRGLSVQASKWAEVLLSLFIFCWFLAGSYFVFHTYDSTPSCSMAPGGRIDCGPSCSSALLTFTMWLMSATYGVGGLLCCCLCCSGIMLGLRKGD